MAQRGRPKAELVLSDEERETLQRWARRPKSPQSLALRSKIVLACAEGRTNQQVAVALHCSDTTVGKWRSRFVARRLKGLPDEHRPGVPRKTTDDHVEAVARPATLAGRRRRNPVGPGRTGTETKPAEEWGQGTAPGFRWG